MPEVKTKTICAPCLNGPLHGKIARRPYDMEAFVAIGTAGITHEYRLSPTMQPDQADGYYQHCWLYTGTTVKTK